MSYGRMSRAAMRYDADLEQEAYVLLEDCL